MRVPPSRKFEALLQVYTEAAFVIDSEGCYREVIKGTGGVESQYEAAEELEGQRLHDVFDASTADRFLTTVRDVVASGDAESLEYDLNVDGETRWFEAAVAPIPAAGSEPDAVIWAVSDVTDRKVRDQALTSLHATATRLAVSESVEAVCRETIRAAETILSFDQSVIALERDGILEVAATSNELAPDDTRAIPVGEGIAGRTFERGETMLVDDVREYGIDRRQSPHRSVLSLAIGSHGNFQAVSRERGAFDETDVELAELLIAQVDATLTRLHHEAQLRAQNERLDEFASIVSHDLRNPLSVAMGYLRLAREEADSENLERVDQAHERMESLIDDLLTIARSDEDLGATEGVDLQTLCWACWEAVETRGATLEVTTTRTVEADPRRLRQLFENLFRNCVEHGSTSNRRQSGDSVEHGSTGSRPEADDSPEHGGDAVTVRVGDVADGFYVEDDGPGVDEADRPGLFEAGYTTKPHGTGFGLYIVGRVAASHGWAYEVTDGRDGGARFVFTGLDDDGTESTE
jgi:PAS domain S-box-containing protein